MGFTVYSTPPSFGRFKKDNGDSSVDQTGYPVGGS